MAVGTRQLLLIARPGPVAEGLFAILSSIGTIQVCGRLDGLPETLAAPEVPAPGQVILEFGPMEHHVSAKVRQVRRLWPGAKCLVLADDVQQRGAARRAGAHAALVTGCPPTELLATVESLFT